MSPIWLSLNNKSGEIMSRPLVIGAATALLLEKSDASSLSVQSLYEVM